MQTMFETDKALPSQYSGQTGSTLRVWSAKSKKD